MANNYPTAIAVLLSHEGGYVDDPRDPGGATNFGITLATLQDYAKRYGLVHDGLDLDVDHNGHIDINDIRKMDPAFAAAFFRDFVWLPLSLDKIVDENVATKIFDEAANLGPAGMARVVCNALTANGVRNLHPGPIDAALVALINRQNPTRFLIWLKRSLVVNYERIAEARPASEVFLKGWIARANS